MSDNKNFKRAKAAKYDEFYTRYEDIRDEIDAYVSYDDQAFNGKTILLPCDDYRFSNFTKYFKDNFDRFGLRMLISSCYVNGGNGMYEIVERIGEQKHTYYSTYYGDGDFLSEEVASMLELSDIVITNPPFSKLNEFVKWIMDSGKKFIIVGNINVVKYSSAFDHIKNGDIWCGYRTVNKELLFIVEESYKEYLKNERDVGSSYRVMDGDVYQKLSNAIWITNMLHKNNDSIPKLNTMDYNIKNNKRLVNKLNDTYRSETYPKCDNYDCIEVPYVSAIPTDYDGVMAVPITFFGIYDPQRYEIVGCTQFTEPINKTYSGIMIDEDGTMKDFTINNSNGVMINIGRYDPAMNGGGDIM